MCQTLANPKRIEIIDLLRNGELPVAELLRQTGLLKANLSQHLSVLRSKGIVRSRKEGLAVYYRIANQKIVKACDLMREVLFEQMRERGEVLKKWRKKI